MAKPARTDAMPAQRQAGTILMTSLRPEHSRAAHPAQIVSLQSIFIMPHVNLDALWSPLLMGDSAYRVCIADLEHA